jgi:formylmethanofuran dehydrogenase subunit E
MKNPDSKADADLTTLIDKAADFHGHLGPFLVIGVRMGKLAKEILNTSSKKNRLQATAKVPLSTPFSCILDGIQATTSCTVGNQRLKIKNSKKEITAHFELQNSNRAVKITANPKIIEELMNKMSESASVEELAWKIAQASEDQLFRIEKQ